MKKKEFFTKSKKLPNYDKPKEGIEKIEKKPRGKSKKNYVDPKIFKDEILLFYKTGVITPLLAQSVYDIAKRLSFAPNFINYSYREEMIGDAVIKMIAALRNKKFDPKYGSSPFSYFTRISYNAYRNRIKKEKKAHEVLLEYQNEVFNTLSDAGYIVNQHQSPEFNEDNEYLDDVQPEHYENNNIGDNKNNV